MPEKENTIVFRREIEHLKVSELDIVKNSDMKSQHYHDSIELFVLMEGKRYFFTDRKIRVLEAGSVILIAPGQIHKTSTYNDDPRHRRFLLQFSREGSETLIRSFFSMSFDEFGQKYSGAAVFRKERWKTLLQAAENLKNEFGREKPFLPLVRLQAHEILLLYAEELDYIRGLQEEEQNTVLLSSDIHNSIQQVIEYLNEHYMDEILLDDLSRRFFISRAYLTRSFKQMTGVTVIQYLTVIRIRQACVMLKDTSESIASIAEKCGFSNATYFENVFRRLHGMTPGNYRRKVGRN